MYTFHHLVPFQKDDDDDDDEFIGRLSQLCARYGPI
jgi:hypothetical protein